ncbi:MAG: hypothetical protein BMS9Abin05_1146 [Rhodothermia bacterium]|nr:MAG: hypothetical protein BMS9Abin05_1146 [Rhodothermia bacterium]
MKGLKNFPILASALLLLGCQQNVQSQQQLFPGPEDTEIVRDSIAVGRLNAITRAVEFASPAVVSINVIKTIQTVDPFSDPFYRFFYGRQRSRVRERQIQNIGSGFVISPDGYIVTNDHVAGEATAITVALPDGRTYEAVLIGADPTSDLSLIKIDTEDPLPFLRFSSSGNPIVGEWSIALGNPFGLFEASDPTVTVGVVSATGRDLQPLEGRAYRDMIQTDAAINRGNSGGPLLNALGEVIGVNTAIVTQSGGSVGIGFAVPADKAVRILNELRENGFVDRSYFIGLRGQNMTARIARRLNMSQSVGVLVESVDPNSPAETAGFKPWDIIVSVASEEVDSQPEFAARLYDFRPGDTVEVGVIRKGRPVTLMMELGRLPSG